MTLLINKFNYKILKKQTSENGYRVYLTDDGRKLPSVTTILSETTDKNQLIRWRQRVGKAEADYITKLSSGIGTCLHKNLENHIQGIERPTGNSLVRTQGKELADIIIKKGLSKVNEVWGLETSLYYPELYAGTVDLVGMYNGEPAIMDFKNTRKPKKEEYIDNYKMQITAYSLAHNVVYNTNITKGIIFMISREPPYYGEYQEFVFDIEPWIEPWLKTIEKFYNI